MILPALDYGPEERLLLEFVSVCFRICLTQPSRADVLPLNQPRSREGPIPTILVP